MIKVLEDAIARIRTWPEARQEDVAQVLDAMERSGTDLYRLTDEEREAVAVGLAQAERGEFVSDADMEVFWKRNRR